MVNNYNAYTNYPFSELFGSVVKQQIIKFLTESPDKEFTVLEIAQSLGLNPSSVSVPLSALEDGGLLESRKDGKSRFYKMKNKYATHFKEVYDSLGAVQAAALRDKRKDK